MSMAYLIIYTAISYGFIMASIILVKTKLSVKYYYFCFLKLTPLLFYHHYQTPLMKITLKILLIIIIDLY